MDVKPGYKQTGVGIVPEDWEVTTIADLAPLQRGFDLPTSQLEEGSYPVVYSNGVMNYHKVPMVKGPGVVTGRSGTLGKVHFVEVDYWPHNTSLWVTKFNNNDPRFIYYLYSFVGFERFASGSGVPTLNRNDAHSFHVATPSTRSEQNAIAEALSDADAYIASLEQLIAKKRLIKQGAMQELLKPTEGWVEKKLGHTATLKARIGWQGLTTAEYLSTGDYFLVTGTEFKNGYIDWDSCHYVSESRYKQDKNIQLKEYDVLVTKDGTIGKVALITYLEKPVTLNSGVFVIRPIGEAFYPQFFYYLLLSDVFTKFLNQLSAGSTINHLYQKDFVNFTYQTPVTIEEQARIATILSDMDSELAVFEEKLKKARQLKQGMMQELLTGRIRLI